jgi:acyl-CoA dehydrogenase
MIPELSPRATALRDQVAAFMAERVLPAEPAVEREIAAGGWTPSGTIESLKVEASKAGLWNLFIPDTERGAGLTVREYASLAEVMGRCWWASEVFNCSAPDTGNMDVLLAYGTKAQQERWLAPLLDGTIRSCFAMTEPDVASSDATNIRTRIAREGDSLIVSGRKWWTSGAGDPRCAIAVVMGQTNPDAPPHQRQSMVLVPMDTPGVKVTRMLTVFGYDDAPHGHGDVTFDNVRVPVENLIAGEGRGFEIAQGRLGPGRIHHCMRLIGQAERALDLMIRRARSRVAFGSPLVTRGSIREAIARSRVEIDQARLLVLHAAHRIDTVGAKAARREIAMIKVIAPVMALAVIDRAIQVHGGAGVSQDTFLARAWAQARTLRLADGPDEVHLESVARLEIASTGE